MLFRANLLKKRWYLNIIYLIFMFECGGAVKDYISEGEHPINVVKKSATLINTTQKTAFPDWSAFGNQGVLVRIPGLTCF